MPLLDFREVSKSPAGEDLEGLVRELGVALKLKPEWSGRGADQGRDLFFTELRAGTIGSYSLKWLVSCKDHAQSGRSAPESDVGSVLDKLKQHRAQGFLFVTTTTASTGLKAMLDGLNEPGLVETCVWDRHELERMLLRDEHAEIAKRFMPTSYVGWRRLSSLSQALEALDVLLPAPIVANVKKVIDAYRAGDDGWLTGNQIWPYDEASARTIDQALKALLDGGDATQAARVLVQGEIEYDAFERLLGTLVAVRPERTRYLCEELVRARQSDGVSLFAYRFLADHYEPNSEEQIELASELSAVDLNDLFGDEVAAFIGDAFASDPTKYRAWTDLGVLSSQTVLDEAYAYDITLAGDPQLSRVTFRATLTISVTPTYDRESAQSLFFPGAAEGYFDANGMYLEDVTVDTTRFYA